MSDGCTINANEVIAKLRQIDYASLNDTFRSAIAKSIQILKDETLSQLRSTGVNVDSPFKKHGRSYQNLSTGVIAEVGDSGTEGRVRVAQASKKGYSSTERGSFALKWFEQGTQERYRKPAGKYKAKDKYGKTHIYKRDVGEGYTGKIMAYGFFDTAITSTEDAVSQALERNITDAINKIWNS